MHHPRIGNDNILMKVGSSIKTDNNNKLHLVSSSRVDADGFAAAAAAQYHRTMSTPLGNSIPMSRTKSTPLGGMSYAMRRVLSRDDRDRPAAAVLKQKANLLSNSN